MVAAEDDGRLDAGLARLFGPPSRKRKRGPNVSVAEAVAWIKKGVRTAPNQALAVRKTLAALVSALKTPTVPMADVRTVLASLFERSKVFRDEFVRGMHPFFQLWAAKGLYSIELLELLEAWDAQYHAVYPALHAAFQAIPSKFMGLLAAKRAQEAAAAEEVKVARRMAEMQFEHMCNQLEEAEATIGQLVREMDAGLAMLVPDVDDCFEALLPTPATAFDDDDDDEEWEDVLPRSVVEHTTADHLTLADVIAQCGLGSAAYSLTITVPALADARPSLEHVRVVVREGALQLRKRYLPLLRQWQATAAACPKAPPEAAARVAALDASVRRVVLKWTELDRGNTQAH
ncbi:hypothetical protein ACHHYP_17080 [Achlya hypogyna]|uniref:Uncharacterized protein n=1 Tax=Achlya hypogyna TaxID=1202772 RepID=A0A1V9Y5A3_ACHHY|nr:hypothetical protein ACHHYP_17080 [Achlya hypogyna]